MFPFLIGRIRTKLLPLLNVTFVKFPFLIGRIRTENILEATKGKS